VLGLEGVRITSVAVGDEYTVAVTEDGEVYSFGRGHGRLGLGLYDEEEDDVFLPERIGALDSYVVSVASGSFHTLALTGADGCTHGGWVVAALRTVLGTRAATAAMAMTQTMRASFIVSFS
jgi:hypothetical protein